MMTSHECVRRAEQCDHLADATAVRTMKRAMMDSATLWRSQAARSASQEKAKTDMFIEQARDALADGEPMALVRAVEGLAPNGIIGAQVAIRQSSAR